jgi:zinc transporter
LHERARLLLDEFDAKMMAVTNRRLFTLSILTACLLPPTLVTGFFGMNTKDMPFQNTEGGTWMAALVALAAGLACYWALRRLRAFLCVIAIVHPCSGQPVTHNAAAKQLKASDHDT